MGDQSKANNDPVKIAQIQAVQKQHELLVQEAREHGIKIVSLKDFLTYLGVKSESRLYIPGSSTPFNLQAASASQRVGGYSGDRVSSGATSKATGPKKKK